MGDGSKRGTNNVLPDPGFPDAEELTAKTLLAKKINDDADGGHPAPTDAAVFLRMSLPKVSAIRD